MGYLRAITKDIKGVISSKVEDLAKAFIKETKSSVDKHNFT